MQFQTINIENIAVTQKIEEIIATLNNYELMHYNARELSIPFVNYQ